LFLKSALRRSAVVQCRALYGFPAKPAIVQKADNQAPARFSHRRGDAMNDFTSNGFVSAFLFTRRRLRYSGAPRAMAHVRLLEDALPVPLFRSLLRAVKDLGSERLRQTYQTTFWFEGEVARCLPEAVALALRPALVAAFGPIAGFEWWLSRMYTEDVRVDFHQDRDEKLALATGRLVHPVFSSVLFLNRVKGGLLAVTDAPPCEDNPSCAPEPFDCDLVAPKPNRVACFAGHLTHGVLDASNQVPQRGRRGEGALRLALILNGWSRRPRELRAWNETRLYRSLALPRSRRLTSSSRS
jgi:hypothetical protein